MMAWILLLKFYISLGDLMNQEKFSNTLPLSKKIKAIPGIFGIRLTNAHLYDVITSDENVEIRSYKSLNLASLQIKGNFEQARKEVLALLPMNSPVFYGPTESGWTLSYFNDSPIKDKRIKTSTRPACFNACMNYSGVNSQEKIKKYSIELMDWMEKNHIYDSIGTIQSAEYDGPLTLSFLRRNELMIEVNGI